MNRTMSAPFHRGDQPTPTRRFAMDASEPTVEFGRFRVLLRRRELLADGAPVELGARAFDILLTLIEADGLVVTKEELLNRVWPHRIVEENNLQSHIAALRAVLGPDRDLIRTVSGRGYQFIGEIRPLSEVGDERASAGPETSTRFASRLLKPANLIASWSIEPPTIPMETTPIPNERASVTNASSAPT